jgi:hypothetical protein
MDVQAPICVFHSKMNGEGGLADIRSAFAVVPAAVQATGGPTEDERLPGNRHSLEPAL